MHLWRIITDQISEPTKWRRLNGWLVVLWILIALASVVFNWLSIIAYISVLSIYANVATHIGIWAASRSEAQAADNNDT